jgi:hypothetical protein
MFAYGPEAPRGPAGLRGQVRKRPLCSPRVARPRASRALVQETRTLAQSVKCALLNAFKSLCDDLSLLLFVPID